MARTIWAVLCSVWGVCWLIIGAREHHLRATTPWLSGAALPVLSVLLASDPISGEPPAHKYDDSSRRRMRTEALGRLAIVCILLSWPIAIAYSAFCTSMVSDTRYFGLLAASWFLPALVTLIVGIRAATRGARASRPLVMGQGIGAIASSILLMLVLLARLAFQ